MAVVNIGTQIELNANSYLEMPGSLFSLNKYVKFDMKTKFIRNSLIFWIGIINISFISNMLLI